MAKPEKIAMILLLSITIFSSTNPEAHGERALIIDTDMGLDDARALLAILAANDLKPIGIVLTEGSADREAGFENLARLLESLDTKNIPIFAGARSENSPPWRDTANSLGGFAARWKRSSTIKLDSLEGILKLMEDEDEILYLALGPLTSLAMLLQMDAKATSSIEEIIIPSRFHGDELNSWNLSAYPDATRTVFAAGEIVIVKVESMETSLSRLVDSLEEKQEAAAFARCTLAGADRGSPHSFLFDELATVYAIKRDLFSIGDKRFRLRKGNLSIEEKPDGRVRIATLLKSEAASDVLENLWEGRASLESHPGGEIPVEKLIETFHGHLGPYVVLGYKMGQLALEKTFSSGHFDISAEIHTRLEPPQSCLIDGIQLGAGCTLGKRNIRIAGEDGAPYGIFTSKNQARATIRLKPYIPARIDSLIATLGVEAAGRIFLETPIEDIFTVESGK